MSEKRRRGRNFKQEEKRPIILAKRSDDERAVDVQPKILLKAKPESDIKEERESQGDYDVVVASTSAAAALAQAQQHKTIIVTRSEAAQSPAMSISSPNVLKEQANSDASGATLTPHQIFEPVPQMTRPATVISSTGTVNANTRKLLMKTNTDFLVVGVIGMQGVGKSTIMSLLANDLPAYQYYERLFEMKDTIFPTKLKQQKYISRSRTESVHMFITSDRTILLDSPPVLSNPYKKDMVDSEIDDLRNIISLLSVCHLLIVVQDKYFNMSFIRLLQFAELMKPTHEDKPFTNDYMPNLLFVKNHATRHDYSSVEKERMQKMYKAFFKESQFRIYVGQTAEQQRGKRSRPPESDRVVNTFLLPYLTGPDATSFHDSVDTIVEEFRTLVLTTPRNAIHAESTELTEAIWFDLLTHVSQDSQNFFLNTYEEIHRKKFNLNASGSSTGNI